MKTWRSKEDVLHAGVLRGVKLGSRRGCQVRLPEHSEESEGEAHPQGWTKGPQAWSAGAELMEKWRKNGQMSQWWLSHGDVCHLEQTGHLVGLQGHWSATYFLVQGPDSRDVVGNVMC